MAPAVDWMEMLGWTKDQVQEVRHAGFQFFQDGRFETARIFFEGLAALETDSAYDAQLLSAIYLELDDNEKALLWADRALAKEAGHLPTMLNRAKALLMLQRRGEALPLLEKLAKSADTDLGKDAEALLLAYR